MNRSSILLSILVVALLVIGLVISCTPKPKEAIVLRLVIPTPPGDFLTVTAEESAARFNERAGGEYEIKVYSGGQLLQVPEYLDGVRTGAVEIFQTAWTIFGGVDPRLGGMETPFLFNNVRAHAAAMDALVELLDPVFRQFNQTALSAYTTDSLIYIGTKPVKTLEDWKGLVVGGTSPAVAGTVNALGGSTVTMAWTDTYSNLDKGVIDAALQANKATINLKLTDVISHATIFYGNAALVGSTINLDVWNAMPKRIQDMLLEEMQQTSATLNETFIRDHDEDIETLRGLGVDVYVLPKAEESKWKEACGPYIEQQLSGLGEFGMKVQQIADEVNRQYP